jgi:hypothetical protein
MTRAPSQDVAIAAPPTLDSALAILRAVEWSGRASFTDAWGVLTYPACPVCGGVRPGYDVPGSGHRRRCDLALAIGAPRD